jgi:hypothetical protein
MSSHAFLGRFNAVVRTAGGQTPQWPSRLLDHWKGFVEECEGGYGSTIYEFENDLAVRTIIEAVLTDAQLSDEPDLEQFRREVAAWDDRFRAACRSDVRIGKADAPWWAQAVPRDAAGDFAEDLQRLYGIRGSE